MDNFIISLLLIIYIGLSVTYENVELQYCESSLESCYDKSVDAKYLFYDVNPPEGFNLRRDVYMRFAIMLSEAIKRGKKSDWLIVLPPWHGLYHWKTRDKQEIFPWKTFFDIKTLNSYVPVMELEEVFIKSHDNTLLIDTLYVLQNYEDAFDGGVFVEKWEINKDSNCYYDGNFWGYSNITYKEIICIKFQGKISQLWDIISIHPLNKKVMFAHGEIPLHDTYGTRTYWNCRKSMKFNSELIKFATNYMSKQLDCSMNKCVSYIAVHWRRQDFVKSRTKYVPSIEGTVKQIEQALKNLKHDINKIYIASDATIYELNSLKKLLENLNLMVHYYVPSKLELYKFKDGGIAIIDQIICSHSYYFIGTHESTFTYRIQEEREILGFDSQTTFNILCPDSGECEKPSKWTIVN